MRARWVLLLLLFAGAAASAAPAVQHWRLAAGVPVYFVEARELPMVDIRLAFDAGSARDGDAKGLASLTARLLNEGAGGRDADELNRGFERHGAQFGAGVQRDFAVLSLRSLSRREALRASLENLGLLLEQADFPPAAFERERERMLVHIRQRQQSPGALADEALYAELFPGHPYASLPGGEEETVAALRREDVLAFYRRHYTAANVVAVLVGDLDRGQAEAIAAQLAERLGAGRALPELPPVAALDGARERRRDHPSTQTHILLGQVGPRISDEDRIAFFVGNHILGGGLLSRLFQEIRERRGLAYSVSSSFQALRQRGPFVIGMQTRNDQAAQAAELLRAQLAGFIREGPTAEELKTAKSYLVGSFPLRVDSNGKMAEYLSWIGFYGLPPDYLQTFPRKIEKVSARQVRAAMGRYLDAQNMVTVLVGDMSADRGADRAESSPAP